MNRSDEERISWHMDGELPPAEARDLVKRAEEDPELAQAMENLKTMDRELRAAYPVREFRRPAVAGARFPMWLRVAGLLFAVLLAGSVMHAATSYWRGEQGGPASTTARPETPLQAAPAASEDPAPESSITWVDTGPASEPTPATPPPEPEETAGLSGWVTRLDGNPLEGVIVQWARRQASGIPGGFYEPGDFVLTDEDGRFAFDDPPEFQLQRIFFYKDGYMPSGVRPDPLIEGADARLHVRLRRAPEFRGRLVDSAGAPVAGATVATKNLSDFDWTPTAVTDGQGRFELPYWHESGDHAFLVRAPGRAPAAVQVDSKTGLLAERATLSLPETYPIQVRLTLTEDGEPISDVRAAIVRVVGRFAEFTLDSEGVGVFEWPLPRNEPAALKVWRDGVAHRATASIGFPEAHASASFADVMEIVPQDHRHASVVIEWNQYDWINSEEAVETLARQATQAEASLARTPIVFEALGGGPVSGAYYLYDRLHEGGEAWSWISPSDGDMRLRGPIAMYDPRTHAWESPPDHMMPPPSGQGLNPMIFYDPERGRIGLPRAPKEDGAPVRVVFDQAAHYVWGRVTDNRDRGLDGVMLRNSQTAHDRTIWLTRLAQTGPGGGFRMGPFYSEEGLGAVRTFLPGYTGAAEFGDQVRPMREMAGKHLHITLYPLTRTLAGAVRYLDDWPVPHAGIRAEPMLTEDERVRAGTRADEEGRFSMTVAEGAYRLRAGDEDGRSSPWVEVDSASENVLLVVQAYGDPAAYEPPDDPQVLARRDKLEEIGWHLSRIWAEDPGALLHPLMTGGPGFTLDWPELLRDAPELAEWLNSPEARDLFAPGYVLMDESMGMTYLDTLNTAPERIAQGESLDIDAETAGAWRQVMPMRSGVERFLITDINNPNARGIVQSQIRVAFELPEAQDSGGWIIHLDGSVEWSPYPGGFPYTPDFVDGLRRAATANGE